MGDCNGITRGRWASSNAFRPRYVFCERATVTVQVGVAFMGMKEVWAHLGVSDVLSFQVRPHYFLALSFLQILIAVLPLCCSKSPPETDEPKVNGIFIPTIDEVLTATRRAGWNPAWPKEGDCQVLFPVSSQDSWRKVLWDTRSCVGDGVSPATSPRFQIPYRGCMWDCSY